MLLVVFDTSLNNIKVQKNRGYQISKKPKLLVGDYGFVASNESKMELIHLTFLKKCLKIFNIKKKSNKNNLKNLKIWVSLLPNSTISRKSKNSRMGKGKGLFDRWVFRFQQGSTLVEFLGVSRYRLIKTIIYLNKKFKLQLKLVSKHVSSSYYCNWSKCNESLEFFNKYRYL